METVVTRLLQPATLALAMVIATLVVLALTLALSVALGGSHDIEPLLGPFRWQRMNQSLA